MWSNFYSNFQSAGNKEFLLRVSYMEIYNEQIRDLLSPDMTDLRIHEDKKVWHTLFWMYALWLEYMLYKVCFDRFILERSVRWPIEGGNCYVTGAGYESDPAGRRCIVLPMTGGCKAKVLALCFFFFF